MRGTLSVIVDLSVSVTILPNHQHLQAHEMRNLTPIIVLSALTAVPSMALAQSCQYAEISQEFSQADTFNSAGAPIGEAYAVFQQDRFYVNAQGLLDPADRPDTILVTREARANYGQAVAAFLRVQGGGGLKVSDLLGQHYTVNIEACGPADNPAIQIQSIQLEQGGFAVVVPNAAVASLDQREAALAAREQNVAQREAELSAWQAELEQRERILAQQAEILTQTPRVQSPPTKEPVQAAVPAVASTATMNTAAPNSGVTITFDTVLAVAYCNEKWTERGNLDSRMFDYCMEQQTDGYARTLELHANYSTSEKVELIDEIVTFAMAEWLEPREYQFDMVAYAVEQQGEAYLNLQYDLAAGQIDIGLYQSCMNRWLRPNEPQWDMVEFCTEN